MDGLRLGIGFSYKPNELRFCGPKSANANFLHYLERTDNAAAVAEDIRRFEGLYTYLAAIAAKSGKLYTDYDVLEAYWIGNRLLDDFTAADMIGILKNLVKRGLPAKVAENRIAHVPAQAIPHHNFNVCYVGVGQITGAVPTTIANMNDCMTIPATVQKVVGSQLAISRKFLEYSGGMLHLGKEKAAVVDYLPQLLGKVKVGDVVAVHWGFAPAILTRQQQKNMEHYTKKVLTAIQAQRVASV